MKCNSKRYFFVFLLFFSCTSNQKENLPEPFLIINDAFVSAPFRNEISISDILAKNSFEHQSVNVFISNKHNKELTDTLKTIEDSNNRFVILKTKGKEVLEKAVIKTNNIKLKNNIKVGIKKDFFIKAFNTERWPNTYVITNTEQTSEIVFYFNESTLDSILYLGYVD